MLGEADGLEDILLDGEVLIEVDTLALRLAEAELPV